MVEKREVNCCWPSFLTRKVFSQRTPGIVCEIVIWRTQSFHWSYLELSPPASRPWKFGSSNLSLEFLNPWISTIRQSRAWFHLEYIDGP